MRRERKSLNGFKFGIFIGGFPSDGAASNAMKGFIVRDKVTRQRGPQTTTFLEEKGEPKRFGTEVLLLTILTP